MESLYKEFRSNGRTYYSGLLDDVLKALLDNPNSNTAKEFIFKYFEKGSKQKVFDMSFLNEYEKKGKHLHTVSLYFLGVHLKVFIEEYIKTNFKELIPRYEEWHDFLYTWFLTSLYHDAGSVIEDGYLQVGSGEDFKMLDYNLGKHDIRNNVYKYMEPNFYNRMLVCRNSNFEYKIQDLFTFPESLIKNYFYYRTDVGKVVDHGILAGFLMFDRLIKNYDESWQSEKDKPYNHCNSYLDFQNDNNLNFRIGHQTHFACISNSIIAHNIWYGTSKDKKIYKAYGLNPIISSPDNKITISKWPLLYFLDVLDTIEPVKRFSRLDAKTVWNNVVIKTDDCSIIISQIGDKLREEKDEYNRWINGIYSLTDWLKIKISPEFKSQVHKSIVLTPIVEV